MGGGSLAPNSLGFMVLSHYHGINLSPRVGLLPWRQQHQQHGEDEGSWEEEARVGRIVYGEGGRSVA